jgi:hypothetical protein
VHIIRPNVINDAALISSNILENDFAVYSAGTSYALGAKVIVTTAGEHRIYESLQAANVGHTPSTSPDWWLDAGPTNRWAMFDNEVNSQSSRANSISVVLSPGSFDSLALVEVEGQSVDIVISDGSTVIYSQTITLSAANVFDWYSYFNEPIIYKNNFILRGLPSIANPQVTVTINSPGNTVKCGVMVLGKASFLGLLKWDPTISINDYSTKETDSFGKPTLVQRAFSKRLQCALELESPQIDSVYRLLASYRSTPLIWEGSEDYEFSVIYGFYKDMSIILQGVAYSTCNLEIEGLI